MNTDDEVRLPGADGKGSPSPPRQRFWRKALLHRAEEMVPLLQDLAAALESLNYPARDIFGVRIALEEAIVNGLRHGNGGDSAKCVRIRCYAGPTFLLAEVVDEGSGFNPDLVPDPVLPENLARPSGRGLMLMGHFMTWVRFSGRGNCVTMCKRRSG
jgi:serine/threonine-protein kinase RsbW